MLLADLSVCLSVHDTILGNTKWEGVRMEWSGVSCCWGGSYNGVESTDAGKWAEGRRKAMERKTD